jgi:hypothetical protein
MDLTEAQAQAPPAAKRPRSAAQQAAFEKCRLARQEATKRKLIESGQLVEPPAVVQQDDTAMEEQEEDDDEPPVVQVKQTKKKQQQQPVAVEDDSEYETIDFDPTDVYNRMEAYQAEYQAQLAQLKEHVHGLHGRHESLEGEFKQYGVKQAYATNFV